jgi:hypothetical protein
MSSPRTQQTAGSPAVAFASIYPRLRLVKACDEFEEITVDGAPADLIEAGLLTQEMLDALPPCGRKDFYACNDTRDCSSKVSQVKAGIRIMLWGKGFQMEALREKLGIKAKPTSDLAPEPLSSPADVKAAAQQLRRLVAIARRLSPDLKQHVSEYLGRIEERLEMESERIAEAKVKGPRPSYLRLVVDNANQAAT